MGQFGTPVLCSYTLPQREPVSLSLKARKTRVVLLNRSIYDPLLILFEGCSEFNAQLFPFCAG